MLSVICLKIRHSYWWELNSILKHNNTWCRLCMSTCVISAWKPFNSLNSTRSEHRCLCKLTSKSSQSQVRPLWLSQNASSHYILISACQLFLRHSLDPQEWPVELISLPSLRQNSIALRTAVIYRTISLQSVALFRASCISKCCDGDVHMSLCEFQGICCNKTACKGFDLASHLQA